MIDYDDRIGLIEQLLADNEPREAARKYVEVHGEAATFEEAAADFATIMSRHMSGSSKASKEVWQYTGEKGDGYDSEDTAEMTADLRADISEVDLASENAFYRLTLEFNKGDLVFAAAASGETDDEGEPLFGDPIVQARLDVGGLNVEHVYGRQSAYFSNPAEE